MILRKYLLKLIDYYQKFVSPLKRPSCVFYPTCSEYTKEAILKYGAGRGIRLGLTRILRCHPWQKNHFDPVRDREGSQRPPISNGTDPLK